LNNQLTVEELFPELADYDKTRDIYYVIEDNTITINARMRFVERAETNPNALACDTLSVVCNKENEYENRCSHKSLKELFIEGVKEHWETQEENYIGNVYDFYPGLDITVNVNVIEVTDDSPAITVNIHSDKCGRANSGVNMYTKHTMVSCGDNNCNKTPLTIMGYKGLSAHEFGHRLGLSDYYPEKPYRIYTPIPKNEIINWRGMMRGNEIVVTNDIEMALHSVVNNSASQDFIPSRIRQISNAIREKQIFWSFDSPCENCKNDPKASWHCVCYFVWCDVCKTFQNILNGDCENYCPNCNEHLCECCINPECNNLKAECTEHCNVFGYIWEHCICRCDNCERWGFNNCICCVECRKGFCEKRAGSGRIRGKDLVGLQDVFEVLKFLAGVNTNMAKFRRGKEGFDVYCHTAFNAAIITQNSINNKRPNLSDVLEMLKHLAGVIELKTRGD